MHSNEHMLCESGMEQNAPYDLPGVVSEFPVSLLLKVSRLDGKKLIAFISVEAREDDELRQHAPVVEGPVGNRIPDHIGLVGVLYAEVEGITVRILNRIRRFCLKFPTGLRERRAFDANQLAFEVFSVQALISVSEAVFACGGLAWSKIPWSCRPSPLNWSRPLNFEILTAKRITVLEAMLPSAMSCRN